MVALTMKGEYHIARHAHDSHVNKSKLAPDLGI